MAKNLTKCQKRCQDCSCLVEKNGKWLCSECFNQEVEQIDDCPMGITFDEVEQIEENAKANPVKNVARSTEKKPRKQRERKPDEEKEQIISKTAEFFGNFAENVKITNISKIIEFDIGENHYKVDLIRQRKPKN